MYVGKYSLRWVTTDCGPVKLLQKLCWFVSNSGDVTAKDHANNIYDESVLKDHLPSPQVGLEINFLNN